MYKSFDDGFEVRDAFLDISKAFDKVCRNGIISKLKQNDISGKLISVLSDFLKDRKQRANLNGQVLMQESLRDHFWVFFVFLFISTI